MRLGVRRKAPTERRDADIDFSRWLPEGDTLADASAHVSPAGLSIDAVQLHEAIVKVWLSGGTDGEAYLVTLTATTAQGRIKEACFQVNISECCE